MLKYLFLIFFVCSAAVVTAQGWERVYGGGGYDAANAVAPAHDGGYVLAGYYNYDRLFLVKIDADGNQQWARNYLASGKYAANAVLVSRDSGIVTAGTVISNQRNISLIKTDAYGNKIWSKSIGSTQIGQDEEANDLIELQDGSLVLVGSESQQKNLFILKTDANGNTIWYKTYGLPTDKEQGYGIVQAANGDLIAVGAKNEVSTYAVRVKPEDGALVWEKAFDLFQTGFDLAYDVVNAPDGNFVLAGYTNNYGLAVKIKGTGDSVLWLDTIPNTRFFSIANGQNGSYFLAGQKDISPTKGDICINKIGENGAILWQSTAGKVGPDIAYTVIPCSDGGALASGISYKDNAVNEQRAYAVKTDKNGIVLTSYLHGNVFWDKLISNCLKDTDEPNLANWVVVIEGADDTLYAASKANGDFQILVDTGTYKLHLYQPGTYWSPCNPTISVNIPNFYDTVFVDIPVRSQFTCPRNEVDVATPVLRRCTNNTYEVRYCNSGTSNSEQTYVKVVLDPALSITGSSIPYTQSGDTLRFNLGLLETGVCNSFTFEAFLNCDNTLTGQTHCVSAHIYPDTFCNTGAWDRSIILAGGQCDGDSVRMFLKNVGSGNMNSAQEFVIVEDVIFLVQPGNPDFQYQLAPNETKYWSGDKNGHTYRIIGRQTPGYPGLSTPTAALEGCISDTSSNDISLGFYTMFPEDDQETFVSVHCQESNEPNFNPPFLKRGHPKGYDVLNYIAPQTDLDYLIHFNNVGQDTVQQVIVRDTLSAALDPASVLPGAASHAYDFNVYGNGIVQFTIPNANLLPGKGGFVKFKVAQRDSLPCGTQILNEAAIYFDFNSPTFSNSTRHTACKEKDYWILTTVHPELPGADVNVYPNPMTESAVFEVTGVPFTQFELALYDNQGRLIAHPVYSQPTFRLYRHQIPAGVVFYRLSSQGKPIASGKLIAQ
ncbi:MAG: T9SS type A sorting domain-containing protein [Bacteroidetes bacterium]|nr:T9SS type A sorting domain-containing protein [Bacteroidota bacterium]